MGNCYYFLGSVISRQPFARATKSLILLCFLVISIAVSAQPVISSLNTYSGIPGSSVTISGSGFNSTAGNNIVRFGATKATVTAASGTSLTVTVPGGASYSPVSVMNTATALAGASQRPYVPIYDNGGYIPTVNMSAHVDFNCVGQPQMSKIADLDGDGHPDIITGGWFGYPVAVSRNSGLNEDLSRASFEDPVFPLSDPYSGTGAFDIVTADIDGDGKLDILISELDSFRIYRNISSPGSLTSASFAAPVSLFGYSAQVRVADLDNDGKPDIIINTGFGVAIYQNISTPGSISAASFNSPVAIVLKSPTDFYTTIDVADIDGDGKKDIIHIADMGALAIARNIGGTGAISGAWFAASVEMGTPTFEVGDILTGDLDGDGKIDILLSHPSTSAQMAIYRNTATLGTITSGSLATPVYLSDGSMAMRMPALSDVNGDGKVDIVYAAYSWDLPGDEGVGWLLNSSTAGSISTSSFTPQAFTYGGHVGSGDFEGIRDISVGDINGDGRLEWILANGLGTMSIVQNQVPPPSITSISSDHGNVGSTVVITGANFNTTAANNIVYFGSTKATVASASATSITVSVPAGATYAPISVHNGATGYSAASSKWFTPTFDNPTPATILFDSKLDIPVGSMYGAVVAAGDMDGDGKSDIVVGQGGYIYVLRNISTTGSILAGSFASPVGFITPYGAQAIKIGDMDGDGKPDIIAWSNGFCILRNQSTPGTINVSSFASAVLVDDDRGVSGMDLADIDGDGKLDLVSGADISTSTAGIFVRQNFSSPGHVSDATFAEQMRVDNYYLLTASTGFPVFNDFNMDGKPDILSNYEGGAGLTVLRNRALRGFIGADAESYINAEYSSFSVVAQQSLGSGIQYIKLAAGDIDGDGKPDAIAVNCSTSTLLLLRNISSGDSISFDSPVSFSLPPSVDYAGRALALGDVNGDGKLDIVLTNQDDSTLFVFRNTATAGSITAASLASRVDIPTSSPSFNVCIADLDGDGRPEIIHGSAFEAKFTILHNTSGDSSVTSITGTTSVCVSSTTTLSSSVSGGTWSSSNTAVASVGSSTGVVAGVADGTSTISYTYSGGIATVVVTVSATLPSVGTITGASSVNTGSSTTLSSSVSGGVWSSSNSNATVGSSTGIVTGATAGTVTISYTATNACGASVATKVMTVSLPPIVGPMIISGSGTTTLSSSVPGGTWSTACDAIATVSLDGVVTAVSSGLATITYTTGSGYTTAVVTVTGLSSAASGWVIACQSRTGELNVGISGGTWSSANTAIATVGTSAVEWTGVAAGATTLTYTYGSGCAITKDVTVNPLSGEEFIYHSPVCEGSMGSLYTSTGDVYGWWNSSDSSVATSGEFVVGDAMLFRGVSPGTAVLTHIPLPMYSCPVTYATATVTVIPSPAMITGPASVAVGSQITLSETSTGGSWSAGNANATVNSDGVVTGVTPGNVYVYYTFSPSGCSASKLTTVTAAPAAISGTFAVCEGATTTLSHPVSGGTWSSSAPGVASVSSSGLVTGIVAGTSIITYTCSGGSSTAIITVNASPAALTGIDVLCLGATTTLASTTTGGTWTSSAPTIATVDAVSGMVNGLSAGQATISYTLGNGCATTRTVTVNIAPATITGNSSVCVGRTATLSNIETGGLWSSSNMAVGTIAAATGVARGINPGSTTISYTLGNGCYTTMSMTVNPNPPLGYSIIPTVCVGATTIFTNPMPGGFWRSSVPSKATIDSVTGVANGLMTGTTFITYTHLLTGCFVALDVNVTPAVTPTTGTPTLCVGGTTTLSNATSGGTWSSLSSAIATVGSATGVVTGIAPGTVIIRYNRYCGADMVVTVNAGADAGTITGPSSVLAGSSITLSNTVTGGTWSASNSNATVSGGVVAGVATGTVTISYSVTGSCGTAVATKVITINSSVEDITGTLSICAGTTTTLANASPGGTWSSSDMSVATISAGGVVTAMAAGITTISYTTAGGIATAIFTVSATPSITGTASICPGTTTALSTTGIGGSWTGGIASIAIVGSTGIVTGVGTGTANITYSLGTGCRASVTVTVGSAPSSIAGTMKACPGSSTTLNSTTAGGSWSTSDATIATAGASTGIISGVAAGTVTVTYATGAGCYRTATVTINPAPAPIAGTMLICAGSTTSLTDASPGLSWTSSNTAVATVNPSGVATGVSNGLATITYTAASTNCISTAEVTVNGVPASITGPATGCAGWDIALTNSVPGGVWSSSNIATATVDASTGLVTGVASGIVTITYTTGAGCFKTKQITINNSPAVTGYPTACVGLTTTLSGGASGTWSSSTPAIATIVTSGGYVTGVSAGTSTMTFTSTGTGCRAIYTVSVIPVPSAITGPTQACTGAVLALTNSTPGGVWTSANTANATVGSATGITTIVGTGGSVTISYSFGNNCRATKAISLKPLPAVINGSPTVCTPVTTTLTTVTSGGTWTSSDASVATVGTAISASYGLVTGVSAGTAEITYTITSTGCARSTVVTVNAGLNPGTINSSGGFTLHTVSPFTSVTLSSTGASGGTWTSSNPAVATINPSTGLVTAVAAGTTTITYAVTASCTNITTKVITVTAGRPAGSGQSAVSSLQLYPNPTTGAFTLVSEEAGTLNVFSMDGKAITSFDIKAGINPLTLPAGLASGIYMCRYTGENGATTMVRLVYEKQ